MKIAARARMRHYITILIIAALLSAAPVAGQARRPRADVTPVVPTTEVAAGSTAVVSLKVRLPKDVHVQADKPRDPSLIATALTIEPPAGVTVERITYPPATELAQQGRREKLLVFGPEFEIEAHVAVAGSVAPGDLVIPLRLRYQACNDTMCFPPARAEAAWTLRVAGKP
jgi:hypothetical protein